MTKPRPPHGDTHTLGILRNEVPGRPGCDDLDRIALRMEYLLGEDDPDVAIIRATATFIRTARWVLKGGAFRVAGSRHFPDSPSPDQDPPIT
jgi:hypothetical protein